jgi:4-hydroxy-tetrahydrodipicolinate synthase
MPIRSIAGVLPIAHTPFLDNDEIDFHSLQRQIDWAYQQGAHGYCSGMVSELLRLTANERLELTRRLAEFNAGRGVVVAGVGAESTKQAVIYAQAAEAAGCHAVMAIPPISAALPDDELLGYYTTLAEQVDLPVIVQDASGYVGKAIPLAIHQQLVDRFGPEKILFKPEASPIGPNLSKLRDATGGKARIYEGSGGILLIDSYRRGIAGTMPGMEFLAGIVAIWRALEQGDDATAYRVYFPVCALVALQLQAGLDGFLAIEKYLLHKLGLFATDRRRHPYAWSLDEETRREVDRLCELLGQALAATGSAPPASGN